MTHPAGVLGYGTGLPSGGSDTPNGWARVFFTEANSDRRSVSFIRFNTHVQSRGAWVDFACHCGFTCSLSGLIFKDL